MINYLCKTLLYHYVAREPDPVLAATRGVATTLKNFTVFRADQFNKFLAFTKPINVALLTSPALARTIKYGAARRRWTSGDRLVAAALDTRSVRCDR